MRVLHAYKTIDHRMGTDSDFRNGIGQIAEKLGKNLF